MNVYTKTPRFVCNITLMVLLLFSSQCVHIPIRKEIPTPSATPPEVLVRILGITEPADKFPCGYGTWNALEFGVTTEEQLTQWLAKSELVHQPSLIDGWIEEPTSAFKAHRYSWNVRNEGIYRTSVNLYVISGTLSSLWTSFLYPQTLGDVVDALGEPQSVSIYLNNRYEECAYSYEFYYLAQGIRIGGSIYDNTLCQRILEDQQALLEATWPVTDLSCSLGGTAEEVVGAIYGVTPEAAAQIVKFLQPWSGFGQKYLLLK